MRRNQVLARSPFTAICFESDCENQAIAIATELRRNGVIVDLALKDNLKKQFDKFKKGDASCIITVSSDCVRYWRRLDNKSITLSAEEVIAYESWVADVKDIPDPAGVLIKLRDAGFAVASWVEQL